MPRRLLREFRPRLERLETKEVPSASAVHAATVHAAAKASSSHPTIVSAEANGVTVNGPVGYYMDRITNPTPRNSKLVGPFGHVLVQSQQPVPGQTYNLTFVVIDNVTNRTFTAADGLKVKRSDRPNSTYVPVLTGSQVWAPDTRIVFYLVTKQYYPFIPSLSAGFRFNFVHPTSTAVPGPSGIALRVKYNPATINSVLDNAVLHGPGAIGHEYGLPDTALWEIIGQPSSVIHL